MSQRIADVRITTDEYEEFGRAGIFDPALRLELLEGEIYQMSPIGSRHVACVNRLTSLLVRFAADSMIVNVQNPLRLSDLSEPQPDLMVVNWRDDFYAEALVRAHDVLLLIEVADSSLDTDRTLKIGLYGVAGVPEVWLVNLPENKVEVFRRPLNGAYSSIENFPRGSSIQSSHLESLVIDVDEILG